MRGERGSALGACMHPQISLLPSLVCAGRSLPPRKVRCWQAHRERQPHRGGEAAQHGEEQACSLRSRIRDRPPRLLTPLPLSSVSVCLGPQGDQVKKGSPLGYVEQLGTHFAVEASQAGEVARFKVQDGEPVEYGQLIVELAPFFGGQ